MISHCPPCHFSYVRLTVPIVFQLAQISCYLGRHGWASCRQLSLKTELKAKRAGLLDDKKSIYRSLSHWQPTDQGCFWCFLRRFGCMRKGQSKIRCRPHSVISLHQQGLVHFSNLYVGTIYTRLHGLRLRLGKVVCRSYQDRLTKFRELHCALHYMLETSDTPFQKKLNFASISTKLNFSLTLFVWNWTYLAPGSHM